MLSEAVAVTVVVPATAVPCGGAVTETVGAWRSDAPVTVSVRLVERVRAPAVPVTVTVAAPTGVVGAVVIVIVVLHAGLQLAGENDADAPVGRPDAAKLTPCDVPAINAA